MVAVSVQQGAIPSPPLGQHPYDLDIYPIACIHLGMDTPSDLSSPGGHRRREFAELLATLDLVLVFHVHCAPSPLSLQKAEQKRREVTNPHSSQDPRDQIALTQEGSLCTILPTILQSGGDSEPKRGCPFLSEKALNVLGNSTG
jgi:hypothetical protein